MTVCKSVTVAAVASVMMLAGVPARAADELVTVQSKHPVALTVDKLEAVLKEKGVGIVARVDHAAAAQKVGLELKPTQVLLFGNPKLGTPLMQAKRAIGLDLPLKVLVYEDDQGKTQVVYTKAEALKARYGIGDRDEGFKAMAGALSSFVKAATD